MARAAPLHESERKLSLLKAAFREVGERGFSEVTLDDIARRAGVSKGVTLYHFRSKEDLFRELFEWLTESIRRRMREAVDSAEDPAGKLLQLVALTFPSPSKNRAFFRAYVDFCGLASRREAFRKVGERFYAGCRRIDQEIVEDGMLRGIFRVEDAGEAASTVRAIFDGLMLQWLTEEDPDATFALYRRRCETEVLRYLVGRREPADGKRQKANARGTRVPPGAARTGG